MLFRKKMKRACEYCAYCTKLDDNQVLCSKKGVMPFDGKCLKFKYDPCKRIPSRAKALDFGKYDEEDYSL